MNNFKPFPKNPVIAKFFMKLGRFDELGSVVLNINKFCKAYSGHDHPEFIEGAIFRTIIPLDEDLVDAVNDTLTSGDRINDRINDTLNVSIADTLNDGNRSIDTLNDRINLVRQINDRINDTLNANDRINDAVKSSRHPIL